MKRYPKLLGSLSLATLLLATACETSKQSADAGSSTNSTGSTPVAGATAASGQTMEKNGVRLTGFDDSPKYAEAQLQLRTPIAGATLPSGDVMFDYQLSNFQLTKMSTGMHMGEMANSMKGQHIHNIVDNEPYTALYDTKFTKAIPNGRHTILSFLSRSYHESIKHRGAYDLRVITVGNDTAATSGPKVDVNAPNLFYSRPKDTYSGNDAKKIMLDFYLVNTTLEPGGNQVRATINGNEFMLTKWQPYTMEGLPAGQNTVKLELLNSSGSLIPGPFNSVTRTFTVAP